MSYQQALEIVNHYQKVEFHLKNGRIYHAKSLDEFKALVNVR